MEEMEREEERMKEEKERRIGGGIGWREGKTRKALDEEGRGREKAGEEE